MTVAMGLILLVAASAAQDTDSWGNMEEFAQAEVIDAAGQPLGMVSFGTVDGEPNVIGVWAMLEGLTPGFHGFHIHSAGSCDATTERPFTSAGGHLNNVDETHTHSDHNGDLPSIYALADGRAILAFATDRASVESILDEDGSAIVLHADPDNFGNIPERYGVADEMTLSTGDAGARVGCGVIEAAIR